MKPEFIARLLRERFHYEPTPGQAALISQLAVFLTTAKERPTFVLKGYAGTGKTTVVSALVQVMARIGRPAVLMAPTGRAAKVLSNYSGSKAYTVHKSIYRPRMSATGSVILSLMPNKHSGTLFIVDEASMVPDISGNPENTFFSGHSLLEDLLTFVFSGDNNALLLLGDPAQLPPVGTPLSPALDLEYLKRNFHLSLSSCELTEVVRQSLDSGILANATSIRSMISSGQCSGPVFGTSGMTDVMRIGGAELEDILNTLLPGPAAEETVVITRSNKRANLFNQGIRNRVLYRDEEISAGDYLMAVRNNYFWLPKESSTGFIANGDMLEVLAVKKRYERYGFHFAEARIRLVDYPEEKEIELLLLTDTLHSEAAALSGPDNNRLFGGVMEDFADVPLRRLRLEKVKNDPHFNALQVKFAWALTCHKTQGGQWENVIIDQGYLSDDMPDADYLRWLYTAVTRATRWLYLLNFQERLFK